MTLFTGSARITFDCNDYFTKESVRRLLAKRYAGTALSYSNVMGSPNSEGYYYVVVSGVFSISPDVLASGAPAQLLTTVLHTKAIDAMFLAERDERIECSERFEWIQPIDITPYHQAHPL